MIMADTLLAQMATLLAHDTTTLAHAVTGPVVALIKTAFTPSATLDLATVTEADFGGYAAIPATAGNQNTGIDPSTGDRIIELVSPAGGWRWAVTSNVPPLPQTIYGWVACASAAPLLTYYGSDLFPEPVILNSIGDVLVIPSARWTIPGGVIF
jgi:hypothetical protein